MMKILGNNRGMALITTLAVLSTLLAATFGLVKLTRDSARGTSYMGDRFEAREMAMSGIHLAMAILAEDAEKSEIDSVQEPWASEKTLKEEVSTLGFTRGKLKLTITDELGKIQVNALLKQFPGHELNHDQAVLWENFLGSADYEGKRDPIAAINGLKDWLDSGDDNAVTGLSGAESDEYLRLDQPIICSNGPLNHLSEIFNVKNITPEILTGKQGKKQGPGAIFTVYGMDDAPGGHGKFYFPGKININTAHTRVLAALLPRGLEDFAQELSDYRTERTGKKNYINSLDRGWYDNVVSLSKKEKNFMDRMVRYNSHIFMVESYAGINQARISLFAWIKREREKETNQWVCKIIQVTEE